MDVAVIGGGYAGLGTALALRAAGLDVAVVESVVCGYGASGRNAGHLTPTIGKDLPTLHRLYGHERASALVRIAENAVGHVEQLMSDHRIQCDYESVGNVVAAVHPRQARVVERAARAAEQLGLSGRLLDESAMRRMDLPAAFIAGFHEVRGGILHPGSFVVGLREAARQAGARIYENSPVVGLSTKGRLEVRTARGHLSATTIVIATNAFTPNLGLLRWRVAPVIVQLFRTAPLTEEQLARVGWSGRQGLYTAHEILESYRLTADNRIVAGGKYVRYHYGSKVAVTAEPGICRKLEQVFRARFPALADVSITDHWGGPIAFSLDFLPLVGRLRGSGRVVHAVAFAGHGIGLATYAGQLVADLILDRPSIGEALWNRRSVPCPPEPARWLVANALIGALRLVDARVDRALRGQSGS